VPAATRIQAHVPCPTRMRTNLKDLCTAPAVAGKETGLTARLRADLGWHTT